MHIYLIRAFITELNSDWKLYIKNYFTYDKIKTIVFKKYRSDLAQKTKPFQVARRFRQYLVLPYFVLWIIVKNVIYFTKK